MRVTVLENLVVGILATAAGLLLGLGILGWVIGSLVLADRARPRAWTSRWRRPRSSPPAPPAFSRSRWRRC